MIHMQILLVPTQKEAWDIFNQEYALGYMWETLPKAAERILGEKIYPSFFFLTLNTLLFIAIKIKWKEIFSR